MILSHNNINKIQNRPNLEIPVQKALLTLPEKVMQFGTGVLLRGLPDYYIDKANKAGIFNGSVVMVKSTSSSSNEDYKAQDSLFTHCIRGIEQGEKIDKYIINSSISRLLNANTEWEQILKCAANKEIKIVISNTTEIGISLKENDVVFKSKAPASFPGKLLAFLYQRYKYFNGAKDAGMVILPTELLPDNGTKLKAICRQLSFINKLEEPFIQWLMQCNDFCNTLVDRIVPGPLLPYDEQNTQEQLGYTDKLMIMSEVYSLWVIETENEDTIKLLSFAQADDNVIITDNIEKYRTLKLRLLNGAHTFSCGLAILNGFETVKEAMNNASFEKYIQDLMLLEITPTLLSNNISESEAVRFSKSVLDRFRNPYLEHKWESISVQFSSKMLMRNVPTILKHYELKHTVPKLMAFGFAAYIYFMRSDTIKAGQYIRRCFGKETRIEDHQADTLNNYWQGSNVREIVLSILSDKGLWQTDLSKLSGFYEEVLNGVLKLRQQVTLTNSKVSI